MARVQIERLPPDAAGRELGEQQRVVGSASQKLGDRRLWIDVVLGLDDWRAVGGNEHRVIAARRASPHPRGRNRIGVAHGNRPAARRAAVAASISSPGIAIVA